MTVSSSWNAQSVLASLRHKQQLRARRHWRRSKLDAYTTELTCLRQEGATLGQLRIFLTDHHLSVERSTILRWLAKHNVPTPLS